MDEGNSFPTRRHSLYQRLGLTLSDTENEEEEALPLFKTRNISDSVISVDLANVYFGLSQKIVWQNSTWLIFVVTMIRIKEVNLKYKQAKVSWKESNLLTSIA